MLRRLLACLALITGLAAIGAPVHAGMPGSLAQQVGSSTPSTDASQAEQTEARARGGVALGRRAREPFGRPHTSVIVSVPTVQFGPDRALE